MSGGRRERNIYYFLLIWKWEEWREFQREKETAERKEETTEVCLFILHTPRSLDGLLRECVMHGETSRTPEANTRTNTVARMMIRCLILTSHKPQYKHASTTAQLLSETPIKTDRGKLAVNEVEDDKHDMLACRLTSTSSLASSLRCRLLFRPYTCTIPSIPAVAARLPSAEKEAATIESVCPEKRCIETEK